MDSVDIKILFFGSLKMHYGNQQQLQIPKGLQLGALMDLLREKSPGASEILTSCQIAVNSELEREDFVLDQSSEIAILPPFSGG